ncbi:MAG: hypothetical protein KBS70_05175 [Bacteroidales bacterium]|nr:hypothetical protein [Candidatus Colicola equi]
MLLRLIRTKTNGSAQIGQLYMDGHLTCDTIENTNHIIPTGFYPVRVTHSPHFDELLPIIDNVPSRSGIRIHPGNTAAHSQGCILVGEYEAAHNRLLSSRRTFNPLRDQLLATQRSHEPIYLEISSSTSPLAHC